MFYCVFIFSIVLIVRFNYKNFVVVGVFSKTFFNIAESTCFRSNKLIINTEYEIHKFMLYGSSDSIGGM